MCLRFDIEEQERIRTKLSKRPNKNGYIELWKYFSSPMNYSYISGAFEMKYKYKVGLNKSSRKSKRLQRWEERVGEVDTGIHLLNSRKAARESYVRNMDSVILGKVRVKMADFIAGNNKESVFTQVWLSRDEYRRIKQKLKIRIKKGKYDVA